jgi:hypothetical protein
MLVEADPIYRMLLHEYVNLPHLASQYFGLPLNKLAFHLIDKAYVKETSISAPTPELTYLCPYEADNDDENDKLLITAMK